MPVLDLVVIGGGVTGAGVLRRASACGLSAALLEAGPPGGRTTVASSGLLHGGLRYLPYDAATSERSSVEVGALAALYPGLTRRQPFLWPVYRGHTFSLDTVETLLELYDGLAQGRRAFGHLRLTADDAARVEPGLRREGLRGALSFDEWAVDAGGLVRRLLAEAAESGARSLDGCRAVSVERLGEGARVRYEGRESGAFEARVVVNAAGPWAERVARLAGCESVRLTLRRGTHLVVPGAPSRAALIFPDETGRHVGLYPRAGEAWIGPTDEPQAGVPEDAAPTEEELSRLRRAALAVLPGLPAEGRGVAGARPVLRQAGPGPLSREYRVFDHESEGFPALVTVTGGKLTLFRPMAEETTALVCAKLGRPFDGAPPPAPARGRLGELAVSAGRLAAARLRHALRPARGGAGAAEEYLRRYAA